MRAKGVHGGPKKTGDIIRGDGLPGIIFKVGRQRSLGTCAIVAEMFDATNGGEDRAEGRISGPAESNRFTLDTVLLRREG